MGGAIKTAVNAGVVKPLQAVAKATGMAEKQEAVASLVKPEGTTAKAAAASTPEPSVLAAQQSTDQRRRRGRAATILTGNEGIGSVPVGTKTLLGG